jgi:hypothetical protein
MQRVVQLRFALRSYGSSVPLLMSQQNNTVILRPVLVANFWMRGENWIEVYGTISVLCHWMLLQ